MIDSTDCSFPGCQREARHADGMCDDHHGLRYQDDSGAVIPGALAHLMNDDDPVKEAPLATCKIDGCTNLSAGKGGSWHGMCAQHISEEARRRQAIRRDRVKPPPAEKPKSGTNGHLRPADPDNPAARLADLLPLIQQKREELLELQAQAVGLVTDINELIEA